MLKFFRTISNNFTDTEHPLIRILITHNQSKSMIGNIKGIFPRTNVVSRFSNEELNIIRDKLQNGQSITDIFIDGINIEFDIQKVIELLGTSVDSETGMVDSFFMCLSGIIIDMTNQNYEAIAMCLTKMLQSKHGESFSYLFFEMLRKSLNTSNIFWTTDLIMLTINNVHKNSFIHPSYFQVITDFFFMIYEMKDEMMISRLFDMFSIMFDTKPDSIDCELFSSLFPAIEEYSLRINLSAIRLLFHTSINADLYLKFNSINEQLFTLLMNVIVNSMSDISSDEKVLYIIEENNKSPNNEGYYWTNYDSNFIYTDFPTDEPDFILDNWKSLSEDFRNLVSLIAVSSSHIIDTYFRMIFTRDVLRIHHLYFAIFILNEIPIDKHIELYLNLIIDSFLFNPSKTIFGPKEIDIICFKLRSSAYRIFLRKPNVQYFQNLLKKFELSPTFLSELLNFLYLYNRNWLINEIVNPNAFIYFKSSFLHLSSIVRRNDILYLFNARHVFFNILSDISNTNNIPNEYPLLIYQISSEIPIINFSISVFNRILKSMINTSNHLAFVCLDCIEKSIAQPCKEKILFVLPFFRVLENNSTDSHSSLVFTRLLDSVVDFLMTDINEELLIIVLKLLSKFSIEFRSFKITDNTIDRLINILYSLHSNNSKDQCFLLILTIISQSIIFNVEQKYIIKRSRFLDLIVYSFGSIQHFPTVLKSLYNASLVSHSNCRKLNKAKIDSFLIKIVESGAGKVLYLRKEKYYCINVTHQDIMTYIIPLLERIIQAQTSTEVLVEMLIFNNCYESTYSYDINRLLIKTLAHSMSYPRNIVPWGLLGNAIVFEKVPSSTLSGNFSIAFSLKIDWIVSEKYISSCFHIISVIDVEGNELSIFYENSRIQIKWSNIINSSSAILASVSRSSLSFISSDWIPIIVSVSHCPDKHISMIEYFSKEYVLPPSEFVEISLKGFISFRIGCQTDAKAEIGLISSVSLYQGELKDEERIRIIMDHNFYNPKCFFSMNDTKRTKTKFSNSFSAYLSNRPLSCYCNSDCLGVVMSSIYSNSITQESLSRNFSLLSIYSMISNDYSTIDHEFIRIFGLNISRKYDLITSQVFDVISSSILLLDGTQIVQYWILYVLYNYAIWSRGSYECFNWIIYRWSTDLIHLTASSQKIFSHMLGGFLMLFDTDSSLLDPSYSADQVNSCQDSYLSYLIKQSRVILTSEDISYLYQTIIKATRKKVITCCFKILSATGYLIRLLNYPHFAAKDGQISTFDVLLHIISLGDSELFIDSIISFSNVFGSTFNEIVYYLVDRIMRLSNVQEIFNIFQINYNENPYLFPIICSLSIYLDIPIQSQIVLSAGSILRESQCCVLWPFLNAIKFSGETSRTMFSLIASSVDMYPKKVCRVLFILVMLLCGRSEVYENDTLQIFAEHIYTSSNLYKDDSIWFSFASFLYGITPNPSTNTSHFSTLLKDLGFESCVNYNEWKRFPINIESILSFFSIYKSGSYYTIPEIFINGMLCTQHWKLSFIRSNSDSLDSHLSLLFNQIHPNISIKSDQRTSLVFQKIFDQLRDDLIKLETFITELSASFPMFFKTEPCRIQEKPHIKSKLYQSAIEFYRYFHN